MSWTGKRARLIGWVLALAGIGLSASAANPSGDLRIEVIAAYNLVVDSNVESPSTFAPRSAYLGAKFHNDGTNDLKNVFAYIGNYLGGTSNTPGIYPRRVHIENPTLAGTFPGNTFALTHVGGDMGTADATRYVGTIPAGESVTVYWLITYPCLDANGKTVAGGIKPEDDLWLEYDIWGTATRASVPVTADVTRKVTMRNEISAMANKIFPNTANKVPQEYQNLLQLYAPAWTNSVNDGTPGTAIQTEGIWYDLGNVGAGFDNNGDLVPDRNAWMQPVGDPSQFNPSYYRLTRTYAMVVVKLNTGTNIVYKETDQLYFENLPANNIGAVGYVLYEFTVLNSGFSALMPYQEVASGYDNEKFNGDYGATFGYFPPSTPPHATIVKTADVAVTDPGSNIVYTMVFTNAGSLPLGNPSVGVPLVVQDSIPTGTTYVAGSATNGLILPTNVTAYTLLFSTNNGQAWLTAEPVPATRVTDIQWWLSDVMPTSAWGRVGFAVTVATPYTNSPPRVYNLAGLAFGNNKPFATDDATTLIRGNNSIGDTVFLDTGSGTNYGNGVQNSGEAGASNLTVKLSLLQPGVEPGTDFGVCPDRPGRLWRDPDFVLRNHFLL